MNTQDRLTEIQKPFNWGKAYYAGIRLGYDEGYAAYRADQMEKRRNAKR